MITAELSPQLFINDVNRFINPTPNSDIVNVIDMPNTYNQLFEKYGIEQGIERHPPETVFGQDDIPILTKKSISLLKAAAGIGKTTTTAWITAQAINNDTRVIWIDTEQGNYYAGRTVDWILKIANLPKSKNLCYFDIKMEGPKVRIAIVEDLLLCGSWDILVIDGVRDLVYDINSPAEATAMATNLMRWADKYNMHVITIMHENKKDANARGHLGTEMVNKAETVFKVSQNEAKEIIIESEKSRGKPFEPFALKRDDNAIPYLINQSQITANTKSSDGRNKTLLPTAIARETHQEILGKVFKNQPNKKYAELVNSLQNEINSWYGWSIANNKVKQYVQYYLDANFIVSSGSTPHTKYSLINT